MDKVNKEYVEEDPNNIGLIQIDASSYDDWIYFSFNLEEKGEPLEGEIYISLDRVLDNAQTYKQDFIIECKRVIIHSCLHLLGYNDESPEDKIKMTQLEETYLSNTIRIKQYR